MRWVRAADVVITTGCGDGCRSSLGRKHLDRELEDHENKPIDLISPIRDEIDRRVRALLEELVPAVS